MTPRLLLADDDASVRLICGRFFARRGFEVAEAVDGSSALARLGDTSFDAVVADYRLGPLTGIDVLAEALRLQPRAARILMSGFRDEAVVRAAEIRAQVHAFVEKPLRPAEFEVALADALAAHVRQTSLS